MRRFLPLTLTLTAALGFAARGGAADPPRLELRDEKLPLEEIRPLDRRVYIVALDGKWTQLPTAGHTYYINLLFPNGQVSSHRPLDDLRFRQGDVRAVIQDHMLKRSGMVNGGRLSVVVSEDK